MAALWTSFHERSMTRLPARIAGVILMGVAVMFFDAVSSSPVHQLMLPLAMAVAAWLMIQNAAAVLLGATLLTAIHADPQDPDWIISRAYPALAVLSGIALGFIGVQRFRKRIAATREARWRHRQAPRQAEED
jgi:hypothetical protein